MNIDDRARIKNRKRVIDMLRKHVPGKWRYEWPSRWVHESGIVVQAFSSCTLSVTGSEEYHSTFRRSDTGRPVYPFFGHGLEGIGLLKPS
jgi:hypothetical protein